MSIIARIRAEVTNLVQNQNNVAAFRQEIEREFNDIAQSGDLERLEMYSSEMEGVIEDTAKPEQQEELREILLGHQKKCLRSILESLEKRAVDSSNKTYDPLKKKADNANAFLSSRQKPKDEGEVYTYYYNFTIPGDLQAFLDESDPDDLSQLLLAQGKAKTLFEKINGNNSAKKSLTRRVLKAVHIDSETRLNKGIEKLTLQVQQIQNVNSAIRLSQQTLRGELSQSRSVKEFEGSCQGIQQKCDAEATAARKILSTAKDGKIAVKDLDSLKAEAQRIDHALAGLREELSNLRKSSQGLLGSFAYTVTEKLNALRNQIEETKDTIKTLRAGLDAYTRAAYALSSENRGSILISVEDLEKMNAANLNIEPLLTQLDRLLITWKLRSQGSIALCLGHPPDTTLKEAAQVIKLFKAINLMNYCELLDKMNAYAALKACPPGDFSSLTKQELEALGSCDPKAAVFVQLEIDKQVKAAIQSSNLVGLTAIQNLLADNPNLGNQLIKALLAKGIEDVRLAVTAAVPVKKVLSPELKAVVYANKQGFLARLLARISNFFSNLFRRR